MADMHLLEKSNSPMPLYFRVLTELRERILSGEWPCGSRIPGEVDLAKAFGVSVITIRQAMTQLMHDGYIERHRAKGSFVSQQVPRRQNISLNVEVDELMHIGPETRFRLYAVDYVTAPPAVAQKLGLKTSERIKRVVRIRIEQKHPLGYVVTHLASDLGRKVPDSAFENQALPVIFRKYASIEISEVTHTIGAILADPTASLHIDIPEGSSVLMIERDYAAQTKVVAASVGYYRSDLFRYELKLTHRVVGTPSAPRSHRK